MKRYKDKTPDSAAAASALCLCVACTLFVLGLGYGPPGELAAGLVRLLTSRAVLLTDYFVLGGVGAAFLNAGIVMLMSLGLVYLTDTPFTGRTVAALFLMPGFAFFGKNPFNILPFFLGVFLYSRFKGEPVRKFTAAALYSTTLAPIVSELWCLPALPHALAIPLGILAGAAIGFVIVPLAEHLGRNHRGYILFNYGFASGFIAYLVMAVVRAAGATVIPESIWAAQSDPLVFTYLITLCALLILFGLWLSGWDIRGLKNILHMTGCAPDNNTFQAVGVGLTMVNMGLVGLLCTAYILLVGGELSGPVTGAIFTAIGFAASGVHPKNFLPVLFGVWLFSVFGAYPVTAPAVQLAAIFGAVALAPVAGGYGAIAGVVAGMLHYALVTVTGAPTGGLNLYNNGFAAGIVATIFVTLLDTFSYRARKKKKAKALEQEQHPHESGYFGA